MAHEWADREATRKSYELIARYVMPCFQGAGGPRTASMDWTAENHEKFMSAAFQAIGNEINKHVADRQAKAEAQKGK